MGLRGLGKGVQVQEAQKQRLDPQGWLPPPPSCSSEARKGQEGAARSAGKAPVQKSRSEPFLARNSFPNSCPNQDRLSWDWALHWSLADSFWGSDSLGVCNYLASLLPSLCHLLTGPVHGPLPSQDLRLLPGTEPLTPESPLAQASGK